MSAYPVLYNCSKLIASRFPGQAVAMPQLARDNGEAANATIGPNPPI
ncbi:MAG: hypothetical protein K0M60_09860 [Hydrogenophaga sp.]|nr:hypothetical protein [Hydrogenophaga sp.]